MGESAPEVMPRSHWMRRHGASFFSTRPSTHPGTHSPAWTETHPAILRLQGFDALSHIAIIDVCPIHFHEVSQRD